jgi:hypothetical protein
MHSKKKKNTRERLYVYDGGISEDKMRKKEKRRNEKENNIRENVYDLVLSMQIMT